MALSSLSVVGNANRLRRYRPAPLPDAEVASVEPLVQVGDRHDAAAPEATATDPVCGMQVDPTTAQRRDTGAGTVYFCSAGCAAALDAEPQRYAATSLSFR
jgi:P-type Cu+ transporter